MKKSIVLFGLSIQNLKNLTYHTFAKKCKCENEDEKKFKEEEPTEILKIIGLIKNI